MFSHRYAGITQISFEGLISAPSTNGHPLNHIFCDSSAKLRISFEICKKKPKFCQRHAKKNHRFYINIQSLYTNY